jgi:hypothetical protein
MSKIIYVKIPKHLAGKRENDALVRNLLDSEMIVKLQ